jgi:glutathione-regulated potassium-efflux system ancillary protein KefC
MHAPEYLIQAAIFLCAAVISVPLFKRLGLGSVLGYLLAGIVIGPSALQLIEDPEAVLQFAEFGVVLLLFLIGLELEISEVKRLRKGLLLGFAQVVLCIGAAFALFYYFGLPWEGCLVAAMGFAMSSTAIGLASLEERRLLHTAGGKSSFAVLLFQDLSVIPILFTMTLLARHGDTGIDWFKAAKAIGVIALIIVASRTIVRPMMRIVARTNMREIFIAFSLLLVLAVSLAVQSVGLSMALGTFLAGVLLADSEFRYQLQSDIEPAKGLFLGLFFIAVGMSLDLSLIAKEPWTIFGFTLLAILLKALILYVLALMFGLRNRDALLFTIGLAQVGEFAFVIYGIGQANQLLRPEGFNLLNTIVVVSMLSTPILFALFARWRARREPDKDDEPIESPETVIIAGVGRFGQVVMRILFARGVRAVLIDKDPDQLQFLRERGWKCYYGDATHLPLLEQAGIGKARLFVIAINDPQAARFISSRVHENYPELPIVVRARGRPDAYELRDIGLRPIRETFHSALEGARQALIALGESTAIATRAVRRFQAHDEELLERLRPIRNDQKTLLSLTAQARQDLETLLTAEMDKEEGEEEPEKN